MILASKDVTYNNTLQTATNGLDFTKILYLKTNVSQDGSHLVGCKVCVKILLKPIK
jgi:hypothetical protein